MTPPRDGITHKDSNSQRVIKNKMIIFVWPKVQAQEINEITGSNDARKAISTLRRDRWRIIDVLQPDRCKLYWLEQEDRQLYLFGKEAEI